MDKLGDARAETEAKITEALGDTSADADARLFTLLKSLTGVERLYLLPGAANTVEGRHVYKYTVRQARETDT